MKKGKKLKERDKKGFKYYLKKGLAVVCTVVLSVGICDSL